MTSPDDTRTNQIWSATVVIVMKEVVLIDQRRGIVVIFIDVRQFFRGNVSVSIPVATGDFAFDDDGTGAGG